MTTYRNEAPRTLVPPHAGDTTRWLYDEPSGCMTNKLYADGKGPSYSYTSDGKLSRRVWARGVATDYTYDNAGPQALVPEEIVTVPASAVVGAIVGVVGFVTN